MQPCTHRSSPRAALRRAGPAAGRTRLAAAAWRAESPPIDNVNPHPERTALNTTPYRAPATARLHAVVAAAIVTLAMLSGIDHLAGTEGSAALVAQQSAARAV